MMKKILTVFVLLLMTAFASAENRVALVIGNGDYKNSPLDNPVQDAKEIAQKLQELNFSIILKTECNTDDMDKALREFYNKSKNADVALFYFSGHGVQSNGINYLLPIGHTISDDDQLKRQAIDVNEIMTRTQDTGCGTTILILDACRNNPFGKSRGSSGRGLVPVNTTNVSDYLIAFACENGNTADDGTGNKHSPFTQSLLDHLSDKKSFVDIMQSVRKEVQEKTNNRQSPYCEPHISKSIFLNGHDLNEIKVDPKPTITEKKKSAIWPFILGMVVTALLAVGIILFAFTEEGKKIFARVQKKFENLISSIRDKIEVKKTKVNTKEIINDIEMKDREEEPEPVRVPVENPNSGETIPSVEVGDLIVSKFPVTVGHYNNLVPEQNHVAWETEPVTNVSWYDALKFLNRQSEKEGLEPVYDLSDSENIRCDVEKNGWRLPTEKEWKKIARLSSTKGLSLDATAWTASNSLATLHGVGQNKPMSNGLYDLFGLVWEWCADTVREKYRVVKGGAWDADDKYCSISSSQRFLPEYAADNVGFRGVRNKDAE